MADYTDDELLAFLNRAWQNAGDGANSLETQLVTEQQSALAFIAPVGSLSHVSKNSTAQGYGGYNPGNLTLRQIVNIWTALTRIYDQVKAQIISAFSTSAISVPGDYDFDPDVFAQMKNFIAASNQASRLPDISYLRVPLCHSGVALCE